MYQWPEVRGVAEGGGLLKLPPGPQSEGGPKMQNLRNKMSEICLYKCLKNAPMISHILKIFSGPPNPPAVWARFARPPPSI